jgi:hypothetical protein
VAQAQQAFAVQIHSFQTANEQFFSNTTDPQVPAALAPVVAGVGGLNTIKPKAQYIKGHPGKLDPKTRHISQVTSTVKPQLTTGDGSSGNPYTLYMVPADAATIYNTPNALNANLNASTTADGTGVTIGIAGDSDIDPTYVVNYRTAFLNGDTNAPTVTNIDAVAENSDDIEAYLDNEVAGGLAPGATIHFYAASNLFDAIQEAIAENTVDILNVSFGACEAQIGAADNQFVYQIWQEAAAQGIAVTVSTGDNGSASCDDQNSETVAQFGLAVNGIASTPYNVAVGGTDYGPLINSFTTYVSTTNDPNNYYGTALTYIPEWTWNNSTVNNTTISQNKSWSYDNQPAKYNNIVAGSGGPSTCIDGSASSSGAQQGCTVGYARPSWQIGAGISSSTRLLPDVSLLAGNGLDGAVWTVCDNSTGTSASGATVNLDCTTQSDGNLYLDGIGGTSAAAPAFAGVLALVQEANGGGRLGQAAQNLYQIYNSAGRATTFHDVATGNISVACTQGTPNCSKNAAGDYFLTGYNTAAGYDTATGLGSVDVTQLALNWNAASGLLTPAVTVTPSATSIPQSSALTISGTVTGSGAAPTGSVTLTGGGYTDTQPVAAGNYSFSIPANGLTIAGVENFTVAYSGDGVYAPAYGTTQVTVKPVGSFSISGTAATFAAGATTGNTSTLTFNTSGTFNDFINVTCSVANSTNTSSPPTCAVPASFLLTGKTTGTMVITTQARTTTTGSNAVHGNRWYVAGGGAALACLLFWGIPARRKSWRVMLGLLFMVTIAGMGCGGSTHTGGGGSTSGTAAGTYTVTVTGTSVTDPTITTTATVSITVQ